MQSDFDRIFKMMLAPGPDCFLSIQYDDYVVLHIYNSVCIHKHKTYQRCANIRRRI